MSIFSKASASENALAQNYQEIKLSFSLLTGSRKNGNTGNATGAPLLIRDRSNMMRQAVSHSQKTDAPLAEKDKC